MVGRIAKDTIVDWVEIARRTLVDEGVAGLKIDRLANRLGVSRGGFYHNFKNRAAFVDEVIGYWKKQCSFLPADGPPAIPAEAVKWFDNLVTRLVESDGYDHEFDLALRERGRSDRKAKWAVERADRQRLETLRKFFEIIGYDKKHAEIRARTFYYHQIGYYTIGANDNLADRRKKAHVYVEIACGEAMLKAARHNRTAGHGERALRGASSALAN